MSLTPFKVIDVHICNQNESGPAVKFLHVRTQKGISFFIVIQDKFDINRFERNFCYAAKLGRLTPPQRMRNALHGLDLSYRTWELTSSTVYRLFYNIQPFEFEVQ